MLAVDGMPPSIYRRALDDFERGYLLDALRQHGGETKATAASLGISRRALHYRIERLEIAEQHAALRNEARLSAQESAHVRSEGSESAQDASHDESSERP